MKKLINLRLLYVAIIAMAGMWNNIHAQTESTSELPETTAITTANDTIASEKIVAEPISPIQTIIEQEAIAIYDIPQDILNNLGQNPSNLKRPSSGESGSGTAKAGSGNKKPATANKEKTPAVQKMDGYRIQVFGDGRNPSTLQARARARGNAIVAKFPKYRGQVYSFSSSPNWYTRIGNFKTSEEASRALAELKRAFPSYAGEMRVVKSPITIIK